MRGLVKRRKRAAGSSSFPRITFVAWVAKFDNVIREEEQYNPKYETRNAKKQICLCFPSPIQKEENRRQIPKAVQRHNYADQTK
jgi:hypothetical protein